MQHNNHDAVLSKLETLKTEADKINELRIRVSTEVERLTIEKTKLEKEFETKYGTSNIEEISKILSNQIEENDKLVNDFETDINAAKQSLTIVQQEINKLNALG